MVTPAFTQEAVIPPRVEGEEVLFVVCVEHGPGAVLPCELADGVHRAPQRRELEECLLDLVVSKEERKRGPLKVSVGRTISGARGR